MLEKPQQINIEDIELKNLEKDDTPKSLYELDEYLSLSEEQKEDLEEMISKLSDWGENKNAIDILEKNNFSETLINFPMVQDAAKKGIINCLSEGYIWGALNIKEKFNISPEVLESQEIQSMASKEIINRLSNNDLENAIKIKEEFNISEDVIKQSSMQKATQKSIIDSLETGKGDYVHGVIELKKKFNIQENTYLEKIQKAVVNKIISELSVGADANKILELIEEFDVSEKILTSKKLRDAADKGMANALYYSNLDDLEKLLEKLSISKDSILKYTKQAIMMCLSNWNFNIVRALEIITKFPISEEVIKSKEIQDAARKGMANKLSSAYGVDHAVEFVNRFQIPDEVIKSKEIQDSAKQTIISLLGKSTNYVNTVLQIIEKFQISEEVILSEDLQSLAKQNVINILSSGYNSDLVIRLRSVFKLSTDIEITDGIDDAIKKGLINSLTKKFTHETIKIIDKFQVSSEVILSKEVQDAVKIGLIGLLNEASYYIDTVIGFFEKFQITDEILFSKEVQYAGENAISRLMHNNSIDSAIKIKEKLRISEEVFQNIAKKIIRSFLYPHRDLYRARELQEKVGISKDDMDDCVKLVIIHLLSSGGLYEAINIQDKFHLSFQILQSQEMQDAVKIGIIQYLSSGKVYEAIKIKKRFIVIDDPIIVEAEGLIDEELINDNVESEPSVERICKFSEIQEAAKEQIIRQISVGDIDEAINIKMEFYVSEDVLQSQEMQDAVKICMLQFLLSKNINGILRIKEEFYVSEDVLQSQEIINAIKSAIIAEFSDNRIDRAIHIRQILSASDDILQSQEIQFAIKARILNTSVYLDTHNLVKLKKEFNLSSDILQSQEVQDVIKLKMITLLSPMCNLVDVFTAIDIQREYNFPNEFFESQDFQTAIQNGLSCCLKNAQTKDPLIFIDIFKVSPQVLESEETQKLMLPIVIDLLRTKGIKETIELINRFHVNEEIVSDAAKEVIAWALSNDLRRDFVQEIIDTFHLNEETILDAVVQAISKISVASRMIYNAISIIEKYNISDEMIASSKIQQYAKEGMVNRFSEGNFDAGILIKDKFNVSEELVIEAAKEGMIRCLLLYIDKASKIKEEFNVVLSKGDLDYCIEKSYFKSIDNGHGFFSKDCDYIFDDAKNLNLLPSELYFIKDDLDKIRTMGSEVKSQYIFDKLKRKHENWIDEQNILIPFETGAKIFGYSKMFNYIERPNISKHDALHNFLKIIDLYNVSGLSANEFYNNILKQIKDDTAVYEIGSSYHVLNSISRNINSNLEETLSQAKEYGLPTLDKLLKEIRSVGDVFSSWKMLRKYNDLCQILNRKEILDQLKELKSIGKINLYNYIEKLAFHPNIEMQKVMEFWKNSGRFLQLSDSHTPREVHDRKKPSNYIVISHLDLSSDDLRDALVEGDYDNLQVFEPLEIDYKLMISSGKYGSLELNELILKAIGKRREGVLGEAKNPDKLFSELQKIFKENKINIVPYLQSGKIEEDKAQVLESIKDQILNIIYNQNSGLEDDRIIEEYRAKINLKSDPNGVVAGNDTSCCMPFGSGKSNVYTFNPICSLFTIQRLTESSDNNKQKNWRTIAQSVLTKNIDIEKNILEVVAQLNKFEAHMHDIVSDDVLIDKQSIITCDNIEVAPNFKSQRNNTEVLKILYANFFKEYIRRFAKKYNLDENKVLVGLGYTDANISLDRIANTTVPEAPVGYSDNVNFGESMLLDISKEEKEGIILSRVTGMQEKKKINLKRLELKLPRGISSLTFQDSIKVAYIEGKAYKDNQKLIQYLHNMENALIAKDVNNMIKNRPEMSFKYTGEDKKMHGYILAYEGKMDKDDKDSENIVYVSDLASDGNSRAGGSLILAFVEAYKVNYIEKDNIIPIFAQFREQTSYQIIMKQLEKLSKDTGVKFEAKETNTYMVGNDTMHEVIIRGSK